MRRLVLSLLAAFGIAVPAVAAEWPVDQMNRAIEQTNFVVDARCSGTLISVPERLILTNFHCVEHALEVREREIAGNDGTVKKVRQRRFQYLPVNQNTYDGFARVGTSSYQAEVIADDKSRDLAVLRILGTIPNTYASPLGDSVVRGERVYAVGNPAGYENTVVEGIVSNVNRTFEFPWTQERLAMVQFSGGIYGGNSGGALYNATGHLIGVPAAGMASATFIGLAIPVQVVKSFLKDSCLARVFDKNVKDDACKQKRDDKAGKASD
jgi:S1-C subfamily serine protease